MKKAYRKKIKILQQKRRSAKSIARLKYVLAALRRKILYVHVKQIHMMKKKLSQEFKMTDLELKHFLGMWLE